MARIIGVPLDLTKHPGLYRRKAEKDDAPYVLPPEVIPRVRMADPPPGSIPPEAQKTIDALTGAGFTLRVTYGVCGHDHVGPEMGKCKSCPVTLQLTVDGLMPKHIAIGRECKGRGEKPTDIVEFMEKGKVKRKGVCPVCEEPNTLSRTGNLMKHGPTCEGSAEEPTTILPGRPEPPEESIAVRVKGFGAACWVNGEFDEAGVIENGTIRMVKIREWQRCVKGKCAEGAR